MAIISSSLDESNIPRSRKELRLVDSKIIAEEKINKNLKKLNWSGGFFRKDIGYKVIDK